MQLIYSYALPCRAMPASPVAWDLLLVERNVVRCFPIPTHAHVALASLALPRSKCRDWINHLVMPNPVSLLTQWSGYSGIKSVAAIGCLLCYLFSCPLDQWCSRNVFFWLVLNCISWCINQTFFRTATSSDTIMKHKTSQEDIHHSMHPPVCLQAAASLAWICASTSACRLPCSKENFGGQSHAISLA